MNRFMKHKTIQVTPHLYQLGTRSFPVYLSMGEVGMLIEGGTGPTFDIICAQIQDLGIDPKRIEYVALTHTHADHVGALPRLKQRWPHLIITAGPVAEKSLRRENFLKEFLATDKNIGALLQEKGDIPELPPVLDEYRFEVDKVISENEQIDLGGGIRWRAYATPGHSPCHVSFFEEKERILAIGDGTGYFDPNRNLFWPNYFQSLAQYCDSIRKLEKIPAQCALLSHNGTISGDISTYLARALDATRRYHEEMLEWTARRRTPDEIGAAKADWVCSIGALAPYKVLVFLSKLMLKNSEKDRGKVTF